MQRPPQRHKVFVSYYHADDQYYRDELERAFSHLIISKSVQPGDISTDVSAEYIKRLIQQEFVSDASVVIVLVGPKTRCRKHVDWEISAGLNKKVGGYSGLLGVLLPTFPLQSNTYDPSHLPARLKDNVDSGYAGLYKWDDATSCFTRFREILETAFQDRLAKADKIVNSREQMVRNTCD